MKRYRFLSRVLIISMLFSCVYFAPVAHAAASSQAVKLGNNLDLKLGQYIYLGTYKGQPIKWRCVAFEKGTRQPDGSVLIDSTSTSTSYQAVGTSLDSDGYLPLMVSDEIITIKAFDAQVSSGGSKQLGSESYVATANGGN